MLVLAPVNRHGSAVGGRHGVWEGDSGQDEARLLGWCLLRTNVKTSGPQYDLECTFSI